MLRNLSLVIMICFLGGYMAAKKTNHYTYPAIPDSVSAPEDRLNYLATHFWENANEHDIYEPHVMESYFYVLSKAGPDIQKSAIKSLLESSFSNSDRFSTIAFYVDFFIGTPDSEYWNDDLYLYSQQCIIESSLSEEYKIAPQWRINLLSKNAIGSIGSDIHLSDINGHETLLSKLKLPCAVIFANSDCEQCKDEQIAHSADIDKIVNSGWNVVTIYINNIIPPYASELHSTPYANTDNSIAEDNLYVVRRLPSVYLFDKDFKIIGRELKLQNLLHEVLK